MTYLIEAGLSVLALALAGQVFGHVREILREDQRQHRDVG